MSQGTLDPREPLMAEAARAPGALPQTVGRYLLLAAPGAQDSRIRLVSFTDAGRRVPTRPGARAWDTGCFWSIMVRARDLEAIYDDAIRLGWWTQTPITDLTFGTSRLRVVVFQGPDGVQVQAYERLSPPLGPEFPAFERLSQPFNLMQMVANREAVRQVIEGQFGFARFWFGAPYVDATPTVMPLGIPINLTTTVPYKAGIYFPVPGETGRLETIEIDGLEGHDFRDRCRAPNLGILSVSYPVEDLAAAARTLVERGAVIETPETVLTRAPYGRMEVLTVRLPDGGVVEFFAPTSGG